MMTKFLSLLARADVVTLGTGACVEVTVAAVTGAPENEVVRLYWTAASGAAYSIVLTEEGLGGITFDAASSSFKVDDDEGDSVELTLTAAGEVLTPDTEDVVYVVVQEGGSSCELYIQTYSSRGAAEDFRVACRDEGSYRTSEDIIEVPASLADHPMFHEFAEMLVGATTKLSYPTRGTEAE